MNGLMSGLFCRFDHACLYLQDGPEDDDSWMTGGAADLEAELAQRQKELEGDVTKRAKRTAQELDPTEAAPEFDPSEMVSKLNVSSATCIYHCCNAMLVLLCRTQHDTYPLSVIR